MTKTLRSIVLLALFSFFIMSCSNNSGPSATTGVSLTMSATTPTGTTTINGRAATVSTTSVTLSDVKVNVRDIHFDYDHEDEHFKKDSAYHDDGQQKLKGPYIVDLLNGGAFADQIIASLNVPNAKYERVSFKVAPSLVDGDMKGKSISITGTVGTKPFVFWHNGDTRFGAKFNDSTSLAAAGSAVKLAIHLEMDRILSAVNGGVDLSLAKDGNNDGTISIYPNDPDGNSDLSDKIFWLLRHRLHCEKKKD
ncbi:MAG: hypothetical protein JST46_05260 [Bacteroidetes bacterium]|nr:hypothetical protein [Bacteroidota bacterium]